MGWSENLGMGVKLGLIQILSSLCGSVANSF